MIQGSEESISLYVQQAISLLTQMNHMPDMSAILASGLNHYKIQTGLNSDKLHESWPVLVPQTGVQWLTVSIM